MAKAKTKQPKLNGQKIFNIVIAVAVVLLGLVTFNTVVYSNSLLKNSSETQFKQTQDINYQLYKLQFCYEHNVRPCDDIALEEWDAAHPSEEFGLTTPIQLHQQGR